MESPCLRICVGVEGDAYKIERNGTSSFASSGSPGVPGNPMGWLLKENTWVTLKLLKWAPLNQQQGHPLRNG